MRSGTTRAKVKFGGVLLDCEFNYIPAFNGDQTDPPYPESAEFNSVIHAGEDVYGLFSDDKVEELAALCIESAKNREGV